MTWRFGRRQARLVGLLAVCFAAWSCEDRGAASSPPVTAVSTQDPTNAAGHEAGRKIYNFRCYFCHGYSGDAKTLAASYLTPPPRDFVASRPEQLPPEKIAAVVRDGRPGTAMKSFTGVLTNHEIDLLSRFVYDEFVVRKSENTRYHTVENGWPEHDRYRHAFPFARGEIALTTPAESLNREQQAGRKLYLESCVSCHDRGQATADATPWDPRPLSYPRNNYDHRRPEVDATTSATPYRLHDIPPALRAPNATTRRGEALFQQNCAFCHGADGTGKNWIGSFLDPHPRNLTDPAFMSAMTRARLAASIRDGLPGTSMPAWKSVLTERQIKDIIAYLDAAMHPLPH